MLVIYDMIKVYLNQVFPIVHIYYFTYLIYIILIFRQICCTRFFLVINILLFLLIYLGMRLLIGLLFSNCFSIFTSKSTPSITRWTNCTCNKGKESPNELTLSLSVVGKTLELGFLAKIYLD